MAAASRHRRTVQFLLCSLPVACAQPSTSRPEPPVVSPLIGTWLARADQTIDSLGHVTVSDTAIAGILMYAPEGHMSGQLMYRRGRPVVPGDSGLTSAGTGLAPLPWDGHTALAVLNTYDAYFGTYVLDTARHTVAHHVVGELRPNGVGQTYERAYTMSGDTLFLRSVRPEERWQMVWLRAR